MIASADVVVVGSGAFGASAAYHLARRGARVAVLERLAARLADLAAGRGADEPGPGDPGAHPARPARGGEASRPSPARPASRFASPRAAR